MPSVWKLATLVFRETPVDQENKNPMKSLPQTLRVYDGQER
jgi:hypothetical protein